MVNIIICVLCKFYRKEYFYEFYVFLCVYFMYILIEIYMKNKS